MRKYTLSILIIPAVIYSYFIINPESAQLVAGNSDKGEKLLSGKPVGKTTREFRDSTRSNWLGTASRPIRAVIWYPSESGGTEEFIDEGDGKITVLKDGDISSKSAQYSLILLSPGSGQTAEQMFWLGSRLSSNGYIAVSVNHNGTAEEERQNGPLTLSDFCSWERPRDLSAVLSYLLADSVFSGKIDTGRIGAAGFSLGGAVAIWTAGAVLNMDSLKKNSPPPPPVLVKQINEYIELSENDSIVRRSLECAENSFRDPRIKAVFALAPAIGFGFTEEGLSEVKVPVRIVVGDKDIIAPAESNARRYAEYIENAGLIVLPGELGHYTNQISDEERSRDLEQVSRLALEFFNKELFP